MQIFKSTVTNFMRMKLSLLIYYKRGRPLPEDVVDLVQPKSGHDEVELHGDGSEGKDAAQQTGDREGHEPLLLRNGARNLIRAHWEGSDVPLSTTFYSPLNFSTTFTVEII